MVACAARRGVWVLGMVDFWAFWGAEFALEGRLEQQRKPRLMWVGLYARQLLALRKSESENNLPFFRRTGGSVPESCANDLLRCHRSTDWSVCSAR